MRTLLKILQSDSSALWIKFYSLMYEAENVKSIVERCPDTMMEGCRVGAGAMETGWGDVTREGYSPLEPCLLQEHKFGPSVCKPFTFVFFTDF